MRGWHWIVAALVVSFCTLGAHAAEGAPKGLIVLPTGASSLETLAAREIRRYVYLRTGQPLPIARQANGTAESIIIVGRKDRIKSPTPADLRQAIDALAPQQYLLRTLQGEKRRVLLVVGGDDLGTLYGAYRLAERLGVGFNLEGDVVPDGRIELKLPDLDELGKPLFELRGIQPFHDFPEGPDWWNEDDYKAILSQLPKLRMNFFGLHTYPEGGVGPEPTVWIGRPEDVAPDGGTLFNYSSSWMNTLRGNWGYAPKKTSAYIFGAGLLFEEDAFGGDVMLGYCPRPEGEAASRAVFDRSGALLRSAFTHARQLGIKTCVGTETPLIAPKVVRERIKPDGKLTPADVQALYEGMFQRIMRSYPLDYYWLWTPEDWTWSGVSDEKVKATVEDLQLAAAAMKKVNAPFTLATCGWVLGPPQDRALFDNVLPKEMPLSCINRQVGKDPVEKGFERVSGRPKWAIPWMEDDPNLLSPQLWAGRMRKDAADALKYGCTGLMGIHWRTRILAPNVAALADAGWDQQGWKSLQGEPIVQPKREEGALGGQYAAFPSNPIANTQEPALYQTVRYNVDGYHLAVPDGRYTVTLKFCEPHYTEKGKRVFGASLQGKPVIESLDIFAKVGQNKALDYTFKDVQVSGGWLEIDFTRITEFPSIAAIAVEGPVTRKINCGGGTVGEYAADWAASATSGNPRDRFLPTGDFYLRWCAAQFGPETAPAIAAIFEKVDGQLPEPSTWIDGPGGIAPDASRMANASKLYGFVDEMAGLRSRIRGAANLERFDYWLNSFQYMLATERVKHQWALYTEAWKAVVAEKDAAAKAELARGKALPVRIQLVKALEEAYALLLATVKTPGEMGTVMNWEQHILPGLLERPGAELAKLLGELPAEAMPRAGYRGPVRVIVPTMRGSIRAGEPLGLKVLVLSEQPPTGGAIHWRMLGQGNFNKVPLQNVTRGVWRGLVPASVAEVEAIEYYVEITGPRGDAARWPASAPDLNQTVVIWP